VDFDWNRSETIALAKESCKQCQGLGLRTGNSKNGSEGPCNCVLRGIFRACFFRFRRCAQQERHVSHVRFDFVAGGDGRRQVWGRRDEEYIADFCLVSKRYLEPADYKIFRFHYLLGADWKLCCRQLKMDRGTFFHSCYRIQQTLGRVFRELEPYPLYPLDEYFGGAVRKDLPPAATNLLRMPMPARRGLRPPLRKIA
jgi:hypothetical protein